MKNRLNNVWVRGIFSVIIGVLLVMYPGVASIYFVMAIGAMFFIPGAIALIAYLMNRTKQQLMFPFMGLGSLLFGLWLLIRPSFFVFILMYVLGALLVLAGLNMLTGLVNARKHANVAVGFYAVPAMVLIAGIVVLLNPFQTAELPFIVLGVSSIVYALFDMLNAYKFRRVRVEIIEDETETIAMAEDSPLQIEEKETTEKVEK